MWKTIEKTGENGTLVGENGTLVGENKTLIRPTIHMNLPVPPFLKNYTRHKYKLLSRRIRNFKLSKEGLRL